MRLEDATHPGRDGLPRGVRRFNNGIYVGDVWLRLDGKLRQVRLGTFETAAAASEAVETILGRLFPRKGWAE